MGLFDFLKKKKPAEEKVEKDPLDCTDRETEWFLSPEGKTCWEEAKSHAKEMVDYVNERGLTSDTLGYYFDNEYRDLPLFPLKFVWEYLNASAPDSFDLSDYQDAYYLLALFLSAEGVDGESSSKRKIDLAYPDFLDWDKNPVLGYFADEKFKMFYSENEDEPSLFLDPETLITIIRYINGVAMEKDEDARKENWINDATFFTKKNIYSHQTKPLPHDEILEGPLF
jgi:hypothetical protein